MSMMFFADEAEVPLPPREVRITEVQVRPASDGRRVALLITLTPFLEYPNLEVVLYRPDGEEERSLTVIGTMDRHLALTLHVKQLPTLQGHRYTLTLYDEKVLSKEWERFMDQLLPAEREGLQDSLAGGSGLLLITGPPGSGISEVYYTLLDRLARIFKPGGGFVFNTIHNVQARTPVENVLAGRKPPALPAFNSTPSMIKSIEPNM